MVDQDPEQSDTEKSSHAYHTKPDNSARDASFLTNEVSYIAP